MHPDDFIPSYMTGMLEVERGPIFDYANQYAVKHKAANEALNHFFGTSNVTYGKKVQEVMSNFLDLIQTHYSHVSFDEILIALMSLGVNFHRKGLNPDLAIIDTLTFAPTGISSEIKNVIFNDPATIVFWFDGTKTVVKAENEPFDPEKGLAMAITKKALGNQGSYYNEFKKWIK